MCDEKNRWELVQKIDNEFDEFFAEICEKYHIVINYNDFDWDFE